jgi:hypothetical protein
MSTTFEHPEEFTPLSPVPVPAPVPVPPQKSNPMSTILIIVFVFCGFGFVVAFILFFKRITRPRYLPFR